MILTPGYFAQKFRQLWTLAIDLMFGLNVDWFRNIENWRLRRKFVTKWEQKKSLFFPFQVNKK